MAWLECLRPKDPSESCSEESAQSHRAAWSRRIGPGEPTQLSSTMRAADEKTPLWADTGASGPSSSCKRTHAIDTAAPWH